MKREIIVTGDGSTTIRLPDWDECYHSKHGAIQEAYHVFIRNGLDYFESKPVSVLEIGFGTGLNALITAIESDQRKQAIDYTAIEAYPVEPDEAISMNYCAELGAGCDWFGKMHQARWEHEAEIHGLFRLTKIKRFFEEIDFNDKFDIIYFDAFGFRVQPELWSEDIFRRMHDSLRAGGILTTYAARTIIKKNMEAAGFKVSKVAGPPGKREMLFARK